MGHQGNIVVSDLVNGLYTTMIMTADHRLYDLGKGEHAPVHRDCKTACRECLVINAWTTIRFWRP